MTVPGFLTAVVLSLVAHSLMSPGVEIRYLEDGSECVVVSSVFYAKIECWEPEEPEPPAQTFTMKYVPEDTLPLPVPQGSGPRRT